MAAMGVVQSASAAGPRAGESLVAASHVKARMVSETLSFAPGKRTWLAFHFEIEKDWHMYWRGQNDSGMPPQIDLKLPEGYKTDTAQWPAPKRHTLPGDLLDYVYYDTLTVLVPIDVPESARGGTEATITARVEWMVCQEVCVLEESEFTLTLPVRNASPSVEIDPAQSNLFADSRARMPRPLPTDKSVVKIEWSETTVTIDVPGATQLTFFPDEDGVEVESALTKATAKQARLAFRVRESGGGEGGKPGRKLLGILQVHRGTEKPVSYTVSIDQAVNAPAPKRPG